MTGAALLLVAGCTQQQSEKTEGREASLSGNGGNVTLVRR